MKYGISFILLLFSPLFALGAIKTSLKVSTYYLPSGVAYIEELTSAPKTLFTLPSGALAFFAIPKIHAQEPTLKEIIAVYAIALANNWQLPPDKILAIIDCESGFNPLAVNPKDIDGYKKYGLLQWYLPTYFSLGGKDWKDWRENLQIGVPNMAKDGLGKWPVCSGSISYEELVKKFK